MEEKTIQQKEPSLWKWGLKIAASAGLAGMICCVAPAVLFAFGLMGGIYAISFADFFYAEEYHQQYLEKNPNGYLPNSFDL